MHLCFGIKDASEFERPINDALVKPLTTGEYISHMNLSDDDRMILSIGHPPSLKNMFSRSYSMSISLASGKYCWEKLKKLPGCQISKFFLFILEKSVLQMTPRSVCMFLNKIIFYSRNVLNEKNIRHSCCLIDGKEFSLCEILNETFLITALFQ